MSDDFQQRGGSPWGSPPGGGGSGNGSGRGPRPPDVDKIIKEFQEKIKKFLPGGSSSGGKQAILVLIILSKSGGVGPLPDPFPPPGGLPHGLPPLCWKSSDIHYLYSV